MNTSSTTKNITLASLIKDILTSKDDGVTVKEALQIVENSAKDNPLPFSVNYRSVYQQLKAQGEKVNRGKFVKKSSEIINPQSEELEVAA